VKRCGRAEDRTQGSACVSRQDFFSSSKPPRLLDIREGNVPELELSISADPRLLTGLLLGKEIRGSVSALGRARVDQ
jgi:hypothetical protein